MSSMRSSSRPPAARAISKLTRAESAWPRCRKPFGLGAKRKTGMAQIVIAAARAAIHNGAPMIPRFLHDDADLDRGLCELAAADPRLRTLVDRAGRPN